jgi:thiol-disulfide isomerase/thioredoxin
MIIVDLDKTGRLNIDKPGNVFFIGEVIPICGKNYRLTEVDRYGRYFTIEETKDAPAREYLKWCQKESWPGIKGTLSPGFWNNKLVTLEGGEVRLNAYRGKYLFLSIWGEWCKPCRDELDELKTAFNKYGEKVAFLGALKVNDVNNAVKLINEKKINWTNTFLSESITKEFSVKMYPTNILIFPDGRSFIKVQNVNMTFFDLNVK